MSKIIDIGWLVLGILAAIVGLLLSFEEGFFTGRVFLYFITSCFSFGLYWYRRKKFKEKK